MPLNPLANGNQFSILLLFIYHYTHHVVTVQSNVHMYQLYEVLVALPRILLGVLLGNVLKFVHFFIHAEYVNSGFCKKKLHFSVQIISTLVTKSGISVNKIMLLYHHAGLELFMM